MKWRVEKSGGADEGRQPLNPAMPVVDCSLRLALAMKVRGVPPTLPPKSFSLVGFSRFLGVWGGEKMVKFEETFWRSLLGVFWSILVDVFVFFWRCPRKKCCKLQHFCVLTSVAGAMQKRRKCCKY